MQIIKDKKFYKVSKEEKKKSKGFKNTILVLKLGNVNKLLLAMWIVLAVIAVAFYVYQALITKEILNVFTTHKYSDLYKYAIFWLVIQLVGYLIEYIQNYVMEKFKHSIVLNLKAKIFARITSMTSSCFTENQTSMFTQRLNDASTIPDIFTYILSSFENICISFAYVIVLFVYTPILATVALLFYLIKAIVYKYIQPKYFLLRKRNRKEGDIGQNIAVETIRGATDMKSLNFENNMKDQYFKQQDKIHSGAISIHLWYRNRMYPANFVAHALNAVVSMFLMGYFLLNNVASAGDVLFFWTQKGNLETFFSSFFDIFDSAKNIELSASRIAELLDEKQFPIEKFGKKKIENFVGKIEFKNVSFSYEKGKKILDKVSFEIMPNQITAIVGKTGCGKSTTLSLIPRFYDAKNGKILVDGIDNKELTKETLRTNISLVQQSPYIFNMSFKENLLLVKPNATQDELVEACKKSEIHDFIMTTKDKYDTLLGENGINLSGGQRQRLAIARAILTNSKIIMFDESTSSLDNENQSKIQKVIETISKEKTIIVVAHRLSTIINADKIIFMENHKVLAEGTHKELYRQCKEYKELYRIENEENE